MILFLLSQYLVNTLINLRILFLKRFIFRFSIRQTTFYSLKSFPSFCVMRYKRFVQTEQLSLTTSKQTLLTPRLSSEISELFHVTLLQLMVWANSSQMQSSKRFKSGLFDGRAINDEKRWDRQSCVSWWVCDVPLPCWKVQLFPNLLFPYGRAAGSTFLT